MNKEKKSLLKRWSVIIGSIVGILVGIGYLAESTMDITEEVRTYREMKTFYITLGSIADTIKVKEAKYRKKLKEWEQKVDSTTAFIENSGLTQESLENHIYHMKMINAVLIGELDKFYHGNVVLYKSNQGTIFYYKDGFLYPALWDINEERYSYKIKNELFYCEN